MSTPRILLVLDDQTFAGLLGNALREKGFDPVTIQGSVAALEDCKASKPAVVVASQLLPGIDGVALAKQVKALHHIPIVLVSAVSTTTGIRDVRRASGAEVVLPRNFKPEALVYALRGLLFPASTKPSAETRKVLEAFRTASPPTGAAVPVAPAPAGPATPTTLLMPIDPAWLLGRAALDRVTGALRFVKDGVERTIHLSEGRPVVATSNVPEERLGALLIRKEKITPSELNEALNFAAKKNIRLLQVLVTMGVLTESEKIEEVAEQYAERTLALFAWKEASIAFTPQPAPAEEITVLLPAERLIAEGIRRHYDLPRLQAVLAAERVLSPAADLSTRAVSLSLTEAEFATLPLVDGVRTIGAVCAAAQLTTAAPSSTDSLRALYACLCLDLVV